MKRSFSFILLALLGIFHGSSLTATEIQLRDGRHYSGREGMLTAVGGDLPAPGVNVQTNVVFIDDDLRRTYFSKKQVVNVGGAAGEVAVAALPEKFDIPQNVKKTGPGIGGVGAITKKTPFDEHGRRTITMLMRKGDNVVPVDIIQCITELTPTWAKVQSTNYVWDMRMATTSIPPDELVPILRKQATRLNKGDEVEATLMIARFFIQGKRFEEAAKEINRHLKMENPPAEVERKLTPVMRMVRQMSARQLLEELEMRRENGQHLLVRSALAQFPANGVAGQTLQQVREMLETYQKDETRIEKMIHTLQEEWEKLESESQKEKLKPIVQEITDELNFNTFARMSAFEGMMDADGIPADEKVALGVSCWLMGSQHATSRLVLALSALEVRALIEAYMQAGSELGRETVFRKFQAQEAANVTAMGAILAYMKPAVPVTKEQWMKRDGYFKIETDATISEKPVTYYVQLPPEYDPHRLYPTVVALAGLEDTPESEMVWWAGDFSAKGMRLGQAGRHGVIVVTPKWSFEGQREYGFSVREHRAVLQVLRDVSQRFSVDSDRVFLAGRFAGGDAAWDIGLSHPDLWAGLILFSCRATKTISHYKENAALVPIYNVCGELDHNILAANSGSLTWYLNKGFDTTIVEYLGRGREDFPDEIQRIFDWMGRKRRNFYPEAFLAKTMRTTDKIFWWVEVENFPPKAEAGSSAIEIKASLDPRLNRLQLTIPAGFVRVWVGPKMLDFERKMTIMVNGTNILDPKKEFSPDIGILLEDYFTRGDRQNPFYQKVEYNTGRVRKN